MISLFVIWGSISHCRSPVPLIRCIRLSLEKMCEVLITVARLNEGNAFGDNEKNLRRTLSRRSLLRLAGVGSATVAAGIAAPAKAQSDFGSSIGQGSSIGSWITPKLFGLGVASGTPRADSMILWTRLAPEPLAGDGHGGMPQVSVPVHWEVAHAEDRQFAQPVQQGIALAQSELAHSVHPQVQGLQPRTEYIYRFRVGNVYSPVGRFKTLPAAGEKVEEFSFAVASCQAWYHGHYTAWRHMAEEKNLDLIFFVGDYIYEYAINEGDNLWRKGATVPEAFTHTVQTLEQYRLRYSLFKTDKHLQAGHARAPMVVIWDDHEVENNHAGLWSEKGTNRDFFSYQRAAAYRAFYENTPVAPEVCPEGPHSQIYNSFDVGDLLRFVNVDTRQYRDAVPDSVDPATLADGNRSILGEKQERWMHEQFRTSRAQWNVLTNSVVVAPIADDKVDQWDGFPASRNRLMETFKHTKNPVVLTGDIHQHCAAELWDEAKKPTAVELICTSIASDGDGQAGTPSKEWLAHPYVKRMDQRRGYIRVNVTPARLESEFVVVPYIEKDDKAPRQTAFRFETPTGSNRLLEKGN